VSKRLAPWRKWLKVRKPRTIQTSMRQRRNCRLQVETLEERLAPATQTYSGLEFMTAGTFNTNNDVVTTSSPVDVGVNPAQGSGFTPLVSLTSGVQFNLDDPTGTFTTSGAVTAYAGGLSLPLLDAQPHTFQAPGLLSSGFFNLASNDVNGADLSVAGGNLAVTGLHFAAQELDVQGALSLPNLAGLTLAVQDSNYVALTSGGVQLTGLDISLPASTTFTVDDVQLTTQNLQVDYVSGNNEFDLSGSASVTVADNTFGLTLGSTSAPGLVIVNGSLQSLQATITPPTGDSATPFSVGDLSFGLTSATFSYNSTNATFGIAADASFSLDGSTVAVTLGSDAMPGIDIQNGALVSLDAAVTSDIDIGDLTFKTENLTVQYTAGADLTITGQASLEFDSQNIEVALGAADAGGTTQPGIVIDTGTGQLVSLDAAVNSDIAIGGLTFKAEDLSIHYAPADTDATITGKASFELDVAGNTEKLEITLGTADSAGVMHPGIEINTSTGQLDSLDAVIDSDITISEVDIKASDLSVQYEAADNSFMISGGASFEVAGNTVDIALGSDGMPGIAVQNGALVSLDAAVTSNIDIGDLTFTTQNLTVQYTAGADLTITGQASLEFDNQSITVTLGADDAGGMMQPGIVIDTGSGQLVSLDAAVNSDIAIGGLTFKAEDLSIHYAASDSDMTISGKASFELDVAGNTEKLEITLGTTDSAGVMHPGIEINTSTGQLDSLDAVVDSDITISELDIKASDLSVQYEAADNSFMISGGASFEVAGNTVDITLGSDGMPGIAVQNGALVSLDAAVTSNIDIGDLTFTTENLTVQYTAGADLTITGQASLQFDGQGITVTLGADDAGGMMQPGIVIDTGTAQLVSLDAAVNSDIAIGGLTFKAEDLSIHYAASDSDMTISGKASFELDVADQMESVEITLGTTDSGGVMHAGIEINTSTGALDELDAVVDTDITIAGLEIKATDLGVQYQSADNSFIISGGASFALDGNSVGIMLGGSFSQGLVIQGGQLQSLEAAVSGNINLLGIQIAANQLTVAYVSTPQEFALFGSVSITSSFLHFSTTLGNEQNPGILITNGQLQSLNITVDGGFSLFGIDVAANGLTIQYSNSTNELELSGGVMLEFTSAFQVSASISQGGLLINTSTGALSLAPGGLQITASATLGPFSIQNLMISFSNGPGGVNFSASGAVDLPGGIDVDLTQLVVQNGQLDDIGLTVDAPIPIGDTGFYLDSLSGDLQNLNNPSQLVVMAGATISFGSKITIPPLGPIFGGGDFYLVEASGSITVSASELELSGQVSLLGGLLGQGSASIDLNWATGVYMVSGNFSMFDDIISFGGSLTITNQGDITLEAMASVNVPPQIPFIGGTSLGNIDFYLQYRPGPDFATQSYVAAWTNVNLFLFSFTIGFKVDFQGDFSIINGNDVAALTAAAQAPQSGPYVYMQNLYNLSQPAAGSQPVGIQVTATSPVFDGAYPLTVDTDTVTAYFAGAADNIVFSSYQLSHPYVIMSSLSFTVTVNENTDSAGNPTGGVFAGTGSLDANGKFYFTPSGNTYLVATSAKLTSSGELQLYWPGDPGVTTITANYDAAAAYFELLQQTQSGTPALLATYTIDPASNDNGDSVQTAAVAEGVVTDSGLSGTVQPTEQAYATVYHLLHGAADPRTVSFSVSLNGAELGTGYFDTNQNFHFTPIGTPSIVPTGGKVTVNTQGVGVLTLTWPHSFSGQTTATVTYGALGNRVIDFKLSSASAPNGIGGEYIVELISATQLSSGQVPAFTETDQYQTPTVSFASGSPSVTSSGVLTGTLQANDYTPAAQQSGDMSTTVSLYYSTTDDTKNGKLIDTFDYSSFTSNGSGKPHSYNFSWDGFQNLPPGSYYIYAVISEGQGLSTPNPAIAINPPQYSAIAGPFTTAGPTPALSGPSFLALSGAQGTSGAQGVFSAAASTALGLKTSFVNPVTVTLTLSQGTGRSGGGKLILAGGNPTASITQTYASAAAATTALNGLEFVSDSTFTGMTTLTYTVTTSINGTLYTATQNIPLLTPNTHLVVTQSLVPQQGVTDPHDYILTVTITNPGGPDGQDGTNVLVKNHLTPGLTVLSSSASQGSFDPTTGLWTVGTLPMTGANTATLTLMLQADASTQGKSLSNAASASSDLFNYPPSDAENTVPIRRPAPIVIPVTNLNDDGAGSLRYALTGAQNGDTIQLNPSLAGNTIILTSGPLLINQNLTILAPSTSTGAPSITISGNNVSRAIDIEAGANGISVTLQNVTIENGLAGDQAVNVADAGAGLLINDLAGGTITLENVLIANNIVQAGAGVNAMGGGIALFGSSATTLVLTNTSLTGNEAIGGQGGNGLGGSLYVNGGNVSLNGDTLANNQANGSNGLGGGVYVNAGTVSLTDDTVAKNQANGSNGLGGGVYANGGSIILGNDTLANNVASMGGDVFVVAGSPDPAPTGGIVEAFDTIFANPGATFTAPDFSGKLSYSDHNLIDNTSGSTGFSTANGDLLNVNANLAPLGNYGGPTQTMPPLPGSPAIGAGDTAVSQLQASAGLVNLWSGNGNAQDSVGTNKGTVMGSVAYAPGVGGQAFSLDGASAYVQFGPESFGTSNFSVSFWMQTSNAGFQSVLGNRVDPAHGNFFQLRMSKGYLTVELDQDANGTNYVALQSSRLLDDGAFHQITVTRSGTTVSLYIDGVLDGSASSAGVTNINNTHPFIIGAEPQVGVVPYFKGLIGEVQVYNTALTRAQVSLLARPALAAIGSPLSLTQMPALPGLVSYWSGNGSPQDGTGNNNGTVSGGVGYAAGVSGLAFQLDGSTGYIQTGANPADLSINDAITVSAWVDPTVTKSDNVIIDKTQTVDAANYRFGIHGTGQLFFWNGSQAVFSNATIPLNTFTQVAFTLNGSTNTLSFYINGQLDSTWSIGFGAQNTAAVTIGRDIEGRSFQGLLGDVAVYHAVLTPAQMALLARPPITGATTPLNAAYLVNWYQAQGNAQDSAGINNGTAVGGVTYAPGVSGLAFGLNGTNAYVQFGPEPLGSSDFAINFWLQTTNAGAQSVLGNRVSFGHGNFFQLRMNKGYLSVELDQDPYGTNYVAIGSSRTLNDGVFHQITVTRSGTTVSLYIDGVLDGSATSAGVTILNSTNPFVIGAEPQVGFPMFNGLIGDVQIYKTALTPAQVQLLYYNPNGESTDQRGYALRNGSNAVDIGAAEYQYDLSITGSVPTTVSVGGTATYTFTVTNNGPDTANGVNLLDILPAGLTLTSTPPAAVNLAPGKSVTFTLKAKVSSTLTPETLSDTATVLPTAFDNNSNNNSLTLPTNVVIAGTSAGVDIEGQPSDTVVDHAIRPAITVDVVDANGYTVPGSAISVTLAIYSGPAGAVLSGQTTVQAVDGIATFPGLTLNMAGTYILTATGGDLTPDFSNPFTINPADVTPHVSVQAGTPTDDGNGGVEVTLSLTNVKARTLTGPLALVLPGLPDGIAVNNATGNYQGNSYIDVLSSGQSLASGQSTQITLDFSVTNLPPDWDWNGLFANVQMVEGI
jgi:uncharacterized repeat protein (TIGR01451 family)